MTFATAFLAAALVVPSMPQPEYDDCEVITNCVVAYSMLTHDGRRMISRKNGGKTVYELVPTNRLPASLPPVRPWTIYGIKSASRGRCISFGVRRRELTHTSFTVTERWSQRCIVKPMTAFRS